MGLNTKQTISVIGLSIALLLLMFCSGCNTLLPSGENKAIGKWRTYQQAEAVFTKIVPHKTTTNDLKVLGLDFRTTPNLKKLTYLDVMVRFNLDSSVFMEIKLPPGVKGALNKHNRCIGYELSLKSNSNKRTGGFWKDILGFQQITRTTGWRFTGLIVLVDDVVVYVLTSGSPKVESMNSEKSPLGPFQNINGGDIIQAIEGL